MLISMNRYTALIAFASTVLACTPALRAAVTPPKPNVLFLIADAEMGCDDSSTPPMRHKAQDRIARQVERMTNMLRELIEFTRSSGQQPVMRPVDFARYMNPLVDEIRQEIVERRITLIVDQPPPSLEVRVEPRRLSRLFYNLLNNAIDEIPGGGKIFLRFFPSADELRVEIEEPSCKPRLHLHRLEALPVSW